jgi:aryl-alcohol dehydrogenase-like predicted oxidoreductase
VFDRQIEAQDIPFCEHQGIGILTHSSLAKGLLTGRYAPHHRFAADDERSEFSSFQGEVFSRYLALAGLLERLARDKGLSLIQLAIAWLLRVPTVSCVLVGARNPAQVAEYGGALGVTLSPDELARIDEILANVPNPATRV